MKSQKNTYSKAHYTESKGGGLIAAIPIADVDGAQVSRCLLVRTQVRLSFHLYIRI